MITFWEVFGLFVIGVLVHKAYLWNKKNDEKSKIKHSKFFNSLNDKQKIRYKELHSSTY